MQHDAHSRCRSRGLCSQKRLVYTGGSWIRKKVVTEGRNMMEGVRFRGDTPGERKNVLKRKKESRTQPGWRGSGWEFGVLEMHWYTAGLCSPPGSSFHGILQARILEWVAVPSSRGSSRPRGGTCASYISCNGRRVLSHY